MGWKVLDVSEVRFALCHAVRTLGRSVTRAARDFGVSRKTAHKWLIRFDREACNRESFDRESPLPAMADRSRRPRGSPARVDDAVEARVLSIRDAHGWGPRKVHAVLRRESFSPLPCLRTVANVLRRHGRLNASPPAPSPAIQRFERAGPNELWQLDHKGPIEVARQKWMPLSVIDDYSRYALSFTSLSDKTMASAFAVLWRIFGEVGLPASILSDNAFGTLSGNVGGLGWFDVQLVKLGINPIHGRPYHPQTQGKVEAFHASVVRELVNRHARRDSIEHFEEDCQRWRVTYNTQRPHEALCDQVPLSRWRPSDRQRPERMPAVEYDADTITRKVFAPGLITWQGTRIRVGAGLIGEWVAIETPEQNQNQETVIRYSFKQVRRLRHDQMLKDHVV